MVHSIKMETAYWSEIEVGFHHDLPVIIPLGASCKEHGLHLPMNTDYLIANYLAHWLYEEVAIMLAPTIHTSFFPAFEEYPGSATLSAETAAQSIIELCSSWHRQGAKQFYVLNTGISTNRPLAEVKQALAAMAIYFDYFDFRELHAHPNMQAISEQAVGSHADEIETSIMLVIHPEVVRMEYAKCEENPNKPGPFTRNPTSKDLTISVTGAWGNPTLASHEKGEIAIRTLKELIKTDLSHFFTLSQG